MNVDKFGLHLYKKNYDDHDEVLLKYTSDGNISVKNKILKHLKSPNDVDDSATKGYVDKSIENSLHKLEFIEQLLTELTIRINNLETSAKNEQSRRRK